MYPVGKGEKRTGCVLSRLSHVQGPVENHAQIPKRICLCDEGWHCQHQKKDLFTRRVEVHNFGLESVDN
jgi:hypothetical protein